MSDILLRLPTQPNEPKELHHIVIQHPTEDWIASSLPERLVSTLHGREWSLPQQQHLHALIEQAQQMRSAARAIVGDHGRGDPLSAVPSKMLVSPLRKRSLRDASDETLQLERTVLHRAMMQCDLYLPQPPTSSTLAYLLKHGRIPAPYIDRIIGGSPGGEVGFARLIEELVDNRLPAMCPSATDHERNSSTADADDRTLATLLLMDASTRSAVSSAIPIAAVPGLKSPAKRMYYYERRSATGDTTCSSQKQILLEKFAKAVDSSKLQIEPDWLRRATTEGRPCPASLLNSTKAAREAQLRVAAVEDVNAVIENRKRQAYRLSQRSLLKPLSPVEVHLTKPLYSPVSKVERDRCDTAWHDHPFYMFLDEEEVKSQANADKERRSKLAANNSVELHAHNSRTLSRYASVINKNDALWDQHHMRLEEEALDWTSSGPTRRSDAEQRYLAIQLVKEQQHAIYETIRQKLNYEKQKPSPQKGTLAQPRTMVSSRLAVLSAPRVASSPSVIPFAEEYNQKLAKQAVELEQSTANARQVTLPVFLNIRSFA
jgi:hypothetical protein